MSTDQNKARAIGIGLVIITLVLLSVTLITPAAHAQESNAFRVLSLRCAPYLSSRQAEDA